MFERYTEQARRVLFFARYEASQLGSISIETEHLLLGLLREESSLAGSVLRENGFELAGLRNEISALPPQTRSDAAPGTRRRGGGTR
jgi:ATP-dependent Clp protease ATP-binding subunit ClpC